MLRSCALGPAEGGLAPVLTNMGNSTTAWQLPLPLLRWIGQMQKDHLSTRVGLLPVHSN